MPEDKKDPDLLDKLCLEADGIFLFALEGLKRPMANHYRFSETEANKAELQQYRKDSDSVLSFVKDCCETGDDAFVCGATELFNAYKAYCEESGLKPYFVICTDEENDAYRVKGQYKTITGVVLKVDQHEQTITILNGSETHIIAFSDVYRIIDPAR